MNYHKDQILNYQDHQHVFLYQKVHHDSYSMDYSVDQLYHILKLNHHIHGYVSHVWNLDSNLLRLLLSLRDLVMFID
jgi:hypothetical protein